MRIIQLLFILTLGASVSTHAQLSDTQINKIDSLFISWNESNHPGGAVGIMQNGKVIFSKAYGLASLEYGILNTTETLFNTASVSKQFTAMGIVRLHEKGLLNIDDDIRKYLPDMPDFGHPITIRHMLHHTSGMRSLHAMLSLAGWRDDDSRTNADLYRFMLNQKELNFVPGEEYLYCNTGYILMAEIIEKVTNETFTKWIKDNVFEPLGMNHTYVEDRYDRVVPNNATSYYGSKENFFRAVEYWGYVGSGNMHSTTTDLLNWLQNFSTPKEGWSSAFEMLQTTHKLNDGSENNYAYGVILGEVNGYQRIRHGGSIGGFRASISTYPEEQLSVAILTNFSSANPGQKENQIVNMFLPNKNKNITDVNESEESFSTISMSEDELKQFEGMYWYDKDNYARKIYFKNDSLRYFRSESSENALVPISSNEFRMVGISSKLIAKFKLDEKGKKLMMVQVNDGTPSKFEYFEPVSDHEKLFNTYVGRFYSPELESTLDIKMKNETLIGHHARHGDFPLIMLKKDVLEIPGTAFIKIKRDGDSQITGARVSNGRARNVWFEKQK